MRQHNKILVISDNLEVCTRVKSMLLHKFPQYYSRLTFVSSPGTEGVESNYVNVKTDWKWIIDNFDMVISLHCKKIFLPELCNGVPCINLHPGYNPYNKGMYPNVFSIINGLPTGATLHVIDEEVDHGGIIEQAPLIIRMHETASDVYRRLQDLEILLFERNFESLVLGTYTSVPANNTKGNLNTHKDFEKLKELNLDEVGSFHDFYNRLRALTHDDYKNAYIVDEKGRKIFIKISLAIEEDNWRWR